MSITLVRKSQIRPLNIIRSDINTTTSGSALITKVIAGTGLSLSSSTGVNPGTGDVTIALSIATASVLGGVIIGSGLTVAVDGTISVTPVETTWGSITGTLSNQIDLQAALNAKYNNPTGTTSQYIDGTGAYQTFINTDAGIGITKTYNAIPPNYLGDYDNGAYYAIDDVVSIPAGSPYGIVGSYFIRSGNGGNPGYPPEPGGATNGSWTLYSFSPSIIIAVDTSVIATQTHVANNYVRLDGTSIVQNTLNINSNEMGGTMRSWMTRGVLVGGGGSDGAYFGMKVIGANNAQAVIAWGDDSGDNLHFINTLSGGALDGDTYMTLFGSQNTIRMYKQLDVQSTIYSAEGNSMQWSEAYYWGDHSSVGYLTGFTESDPTVPAHVKAITTTNISNWNTAYSWGNHAVAGYQPAATAITTSNIGLQSVNYANSAGSATLAGYVNNQSGQLYSYDNRVIAPADTIEGFLQFGFTSWNNNGGDPYADYLHLRSYPDSSGGTDNLIMFLKSGIGMRIWQQSWGSNSPYAEFVDVWTTGNFTQTNVNNWNTAYSWGNHATQSYATQTYVNTAIANLVNSAPGTLDTLNELAAALGDDPNFATTVTNSIATKLPLAGGTMSGNINWDITDRGLTWGMNTDGAYIKFFNEGDGDEDSRLEYATSDNGDEYHRWVIAGTERMNLRTEGLNVNGVIYSSGYGNSTEWNTAYTWGNHAGLYASISHTHTFASITSKPTTIAGYGITNAYTDAQIQNFFNGANAITGYNKSNWDTAYSWGNHASAGYRVNSINNTAYVYATSYRTENYDFTLDPRLSIDSMSIKLWDNYFNNSGLGVDYGSLLDIYGRAGHVHSQFYMDASNALYYRSSPYSSGWNPWQQIWTSGTLTNLNQLINGPGYITGYTETDTLQSVTSRGFSTNTNIWIKRPANKVDNASCTELPSRVEFNNAFVAGSTGYTVFHYPTPSVFRIYGDYDGNIGGLQPDIHLGLGYLTVKSAGANVGNIGINNIDPTFKLDVGGNGRFTGNVSIGTNYNGFALNVNGTTYVIGGNLFLNVGYKVVNTSDTSSIAFSDDVLNVKGALIPITDSTYNLGTTSLRWRTIYAADLDLTGAATINGNTVWHAGNLTNLNQLSNGPGYITSYTEVDTLASVTGRGATTSTPITVTGTEGREVAVYIPSSYTTDDLVSGHEYGWYNDHWRLGMTRSGGAAGADFVVQWNASRRLSLTSSGNLTATGTITATGGNSSQWNTAYGWGNHASAGYLTSLPSHNHDDRYLVKGGGWYGLNLPGSRWGGFAVDGGEISFGNGLPNAGQMGMLIDGAYLAGENNGFWSLPSDNNWNGRRGMSWNGTYLDFTTNSPTAQFTNLRLANGFEIQQGGSNYGRFNSWVHLNGYYGLYSDLNGAHFYPNNGSYGSWRIEGSRNDYRGLQFSSGTNGDVSLMIHINSNITGFHNASYDWQFYWSAGTLYCFKDNYGGGVQATVLDSSNYTDFAATSGHTHDLGRWSLTAPQNVDGLTSSNFRSTLFGLTSNTWNISTARWNNTPSGLSGMNNYGTMFAWSGSDTHGFIATDYSTANIQVGGGSGNSITWKATLIHNLNIGSYALTSYTETDTLNSVTSRGASTSNAIEVGGLTVTTRDVDVTTYQGRFQVYNASATGNLGYRIQTDEQGGWRWQFVDGGNNEYFGVDYPSGDITVRGTITEQSSLRYKENIINLESITEKVDRLRPVRYNKIGNTNTEIGLIAEEVAEIFPEFVNYNADGEAESLNYTRLSVVLLQTVKELSDKINKLETK